MFSRKLYLILFVTLFLSKNNSLFAQSSANKSILAEAEKVLAASAFAILNAEDTEDRLRADSFFTRQLVQALRTPHSFHYGFDSLKTISRLYAPDSSFRIITWQLMKDFSYYRYKGAIQMNTKDGSLKLIPLYDGADFTENPYDSIRTNQNWIGAVYYNIIQKEYNNKKYYTLLGYDENDARSTKKWIEVLHFDLEGKPLFGGKFFNYPNDINKPKQPVSRFCLEFKKQANAKLNYDTKLDRIVFVKLISESNEPNKKHTLVPYGTVEGFKWEFGRWVYIPEYEAVEPE
ncbi:MAG: hypothetical protein C0446_09470 [Chitinophaga sp.]|uniref:hypothetical protein n=1 Tax=Sediminibacterium sp. TaxID=1917865 RepID=UPI0025FEEECE|nr:hypothetical protein [Sediminibacterium sp.]MBA4259381.1 hypothetical protein [Chitinophaga sp.]